MLSVVGTVLAVGAFLAVVFAPEWVAGALGPRLSGSLLSMALAALGVVWGAWLWYVFSTRGRQSTWATGSRRRRCYRHDRRRRLVAPQPSCLAHLHIEVVRLDA